jgi:hypothetical protein
MFERMKLEKRNRHKRKPEGLGKKRTGWIYWNGLSWVHASRGQLGTLRARGFKVKRLEDHLTKS